jgi:hypothetical protein
MCDCRHFSSFGPDVDTVGGWTSCRSQLYFAHLGDSWLQYHRSHTHTHTHTHTYRVENAGRLYQKLWCDLALWKQHFLADIPLCILVYKGLFFNIRQIQLYRACILIKLITIPLGIINIKLVYSRFPPADCKKRPLPFCSLCVRIPYLVMAVVDSRNI